MITLNNYFHGELKIGFDNGEWDGKCVFCGKEYFSELAHEKSNSDANHKIFGCIIDAPLFQTLPSCRECNSGIHRGYSRSPAFIGNSAAFLIRSARSAWDSYYNAAMKNPAIISKIKKIGGIL